MPKTREFLQGFKKVRQAVVDTFREHPIFFVALFTVAVLCMVLMLWLERLIEIK